MEPMNIASANSFLSLVQNSNLIDTNSKNLYKRMQEIWQSMHQYLVKQDRSCQINKIIATESLTSVILTALIRRRFKMFNDWLEKTNEQLTTKIDFPIDMIVPIQCKYIETLDKLSGSLLDESLFNAQLKPSEGRIRDCFIECANLVSFSRITRLFSEYLAKQFILALDQSDYPLFNVNLEQALVDESKIAEPDFRDKIQVIRDAKLINCNEIQLRYMRAINWMYNDFIAGMIGRIRNISSETRFEIEEIHSWRVSQKRKFDDEKNELIKRLRSSEENRAKLKLQVEDLLNKCLAVAKEVGELRAEASKKMDANALDADDVVRNYYDMSKDLYEKNQKLMAQLETLTIEKNALQAQMDSQGLLRRLWK